jgi:Zn ribbon nucleic-acid-binding protein
MKSEFSQIDISCPTCKTKNSLTYDTGIEREKMNCSYCGENLGRIIDRQNSQSQKSASAQAASEG